MAYLYKPFHSVTGDAPSKNSNANNILRELIYVYIVLCETFPSNLSTIYFTRCSAYSRILILYPADLFKQSAASRATGMRANKLERDSFT